MPAVPESQGAPSTIRCIETGLKGGAHTTLLPVREHPAPSGALRLKLVFVKNRPNVLVREHPAPSGALRQGDGPLWGGAPCFVREHPAPSGALRPLPRAASAMMATSQGAPSSIRCIETGPSATRTRAPPGCQGAPSTMRCIKTGFAEGCERDDGDESGSTQHHQVH